MTLNTIAHTVGAIGAGAKATVVFGSAWFGLFSAIMTLAILFVSEIVPKTMGALYWSKLVGPTALFVYTLIVILYPIVWVSENMDEMDSVENMRVLARKLWAERAKALGIEEEGAEPGYYNKNYRR